MKKTILPEFPAVDEPLPRPARVPVVDARETAPASSWLKASSTFETVCPAKLEKSAA